MEIEIKGLNEEDFVNYKKTSMFIAFPYCTFKCGGDYCQNSHLALEPSVIQQTEEIVHRYMTNPISKAIVFGGLEPFDSWDELIELVEAFRQVTEDDIVIFSGYNFEEIKGKIAILSKYKNIYVKFGRYLPNQEPHYDEVLGVNLASDNQKAYLVSKEY